MALPVLQWIGIVLAFAFLLLIPLMFIIFRHIILRPLNRIQNALLHLKLGDKDYRISKHKYSEEFRIINQSFNEMADNIENLKIDNYEKEMSTQKMEQENLQLQIRPHFLLNMFKLVYGLAQIEDYKSIQKLALYLSNFFRYIFRSGKDLEPFSQEYDLIREYLNISKIRYPNRFSVEYDVDENVLKVNVPPLLFHNFVENVISHALLSDSSVHIGLTAHYSDGWVTLAVADSGAGMDTSIVERVNNEHFITSDGKRVHLGIYNSYQRIKHFYGEQGEIRIQSVLGEGTHVTIRFPYGKEEG
jgi:sensor histidine kinase YesM